MHLSSLQTLRDLSPMLSFGLEVGRPTGIKGGRKGGKEVSRVIMYIQLYSLTNRWGGIVGE